MKLVNNVYLRVFIRDGEDKEAVRTAFLSLLPFDLEKTAIEERKAESFEGKKILILRVVLSKESRINSFLKQLSENLGEEKSTLLEQLDSRLDDDLDFFIRLDKDLLLRNRYVLTDSGNCFHIKMNVASFPKRRETALKVLKAIFI